MPEKDPFDGHGFGREAFDDEDERARHRHMFKVMSDNWMDLLPMVRMKQGGKYFVTLIAGATAVGVFMAWAAKQGFLG